MHNLSLHQNYDLRFKKLSAQNQVFIHSKNHCSKQHIILPKCGDIMVVRSPRFNKAFRGITSPRLYNYNQLFQHDNDKIKQKLKTTRNNHHIYIHKSHTQTLLKQLKSNTHIKDLDLLLRSKKKGLYKCGIKLHCSQSFTNFGDLLEHLDYYKINRRFKCSVKCCPWSIVGFITQPQMKRHYLTVHEPRRLICPEKSCGKVFPRNDSLSRHLKSVHSK